MAVSKKDRNGEPTMQNTLNPETWIEDLKGPRLSVLLALLAYADKDSPMNPTDLARRTGYRRPAVYEALVNLKLRRLVENRGTRNRPKWLPSSYGRQAVLARLGMMEKSVISDYTLSPVVVVPSDQDQESINTTTTQEESVISGYTLPLPKPTPHPVIYKLLRDIGCWGNVATKLACDEWVTQPRTRGWIETFRNDPACKNLAAAVVARLLEHDEPPILPESETNIPIMCTNCHCIPCKCEEWGIGKDPDSQKQIQEMVELEVIAR